MLVNFLFCELKKFFGAYKKFLIFCRYILHVLSVLVQCIVYILVILLFMPGCSCCFNILPCHCPCYSPALVPALFLVEFLFTVQIVLHLVTWQPQGMLQVSLFPCRQMVLLPSHTLFLSFSYLITSCIKVTSLSVLPVLTFGNIVLYLS